MALFVQTWIAKINYTDKVGKHEDSNTVGLIIEAETEEEAREKAYFIAKNAYLTWGGETEILKVREK